MFSDPTELAIPSARKPKAKGSFFQVLYKANWRNIVMAVAGLNAIRFAFATYNAYEDALVDDFGISFTSLSRSISVAYD
ncbi:hypothetical protein EST38_g14353 [Candolleomyces aberdarensis]|uniref:Uncharacterized protein n=1 Tax=Candolleomyces aberdarensis TaxID=2316362 RepID=A0A4Q2CXL3_9AGAR|nr:hypothetical protein EST38_g14353 [Candolleomyces aberdarensis]